MKHARLTVKEVLHLSLLRVYQDTRYLYRPRLSADAASPL